MERVAPGDFARAERRKPAQYICDAAPLPRAVRWLHEFNWAKAGRYYHKPTTILRDAIVLAEDHPFLRIFREMESFIGEHSQEVAEDLVTLDFGDVLDTYDVGFQLPHKTAEIPEQVPFRVAMILLPLRVFRERLARRTANENSGVTFGIVTGELATTDLGHALVVESHSGIVAL